MLQRFEIEQNKDLKNLHSFAVPWKAKFFASVSDKAELYDVLEIAKGQSHKVFILGGGSNILPTDNFKGLVIANAIMGRSVVHEDDDSITIEVGAGESWHDLVVWSTEHSYYGLENLALIPGTVGGAVVQNIGAYDVEVARHVSSVCAIDVETMQEQLFEPEECEFRYRNSIFKSQVGRYALSSVCLRLSKHFEPVLSYEPLKDLAANSKEIRAHDVMNRVIEIRQSKLPDWRVIGTAGSFFANPRVEERLVRKLQKKYKDMPVFIDKQNGKKVVPAGWLIEHSLLDKTVRQNFLYDKHALVLINKYKSTGVTPQKYGKQIYHASKMIVNRVEKDFGIILEREVLVI